MSYAYLFVVLLVGAFLVACDPGPEPRLSCDPRRPNDCPEGWICKSVTCPSEWGCFRRQPEDPEQIPIGCVEDGICDEDACESCWNCPADCCPACDPPMAGGADQEYLARSYELPIDHFQLDASALDLDGDDVVEAQFGLVMNLLFGGLEILRPELVLRDWVAEGSLLVALRLYPDMSAPEGDAWMVQILPAEILDDIPSFDGTDVVQLRPEASTDVAFCGAIGPGPPERFVSRTSAAPIWFPVPHFGIGQTAMLELHHARVEALRGADGRWQEVYLGGGLRRTDIYAELYPPIIELFNAIIATEPESRRAQLIIGTYDGNCAAMDDVPGCEEVYSDHPDCSEQDDPPVITMTEVLCNALHGSATRPDIDANDDGEPDLMSFAVFLPLVPATVLD